MIFIATAAIIPASKVKEAENCEGATNNIFAVRAPEITGLRVFSSASGFEYNSRDNAKGSNTGAICPRRGGGGEHVVGGSAS